MKKNELLRTAVLSLGGAVYALSLAPAPSLAQNVQRQFSGAHLQSVVYDGSTRHGWYSFPGQSPKLQFKGNDLRITSQQHSTVLLTRVGDSFGAAAEVALIRPPKSTSSISGLAVMSDPQHALVIGLEGGSVVLWQLDPSGARALARQPVNPDSRLEFRVTGVDMANVRFFWRHLKGGVWHPLGGAEVQQALANWRGPLHLGLLLDGPQGSEVTFSNYRAAGSNIASNAVPAWPMLAAGQ